MKYRAPEYSGDDSSDDSYGAGDQGKTTGDCPSQLSDERTELLELQWRDGCPVEQPVLDQRSSNSDDAGGASSPGEKKSKAGGGPKDAAAGGGEAVEEWWRLWREGESGGCAAGAAAAHGYPQLVDDLSSVNAKAATASVGPKQRMGTTADEETADELWRMWREGHGSSAPQDSSCKNSMLKEEDSVLPCSAASRGSGGAQRHSSEQIDEQCSTLDHAIEYMKSLQQQIQVLSCSGYGMQQLLFPCTCSQAPHTVVTAAPVPAPAAPPGPAMPPPPPPPQAAAAAPLCPTLPLPLPPQPAAVVPDLNPVMLGPPGALSFSGLVRMNAGVADEMASNTSEIPFGGCPRCSFRRRAGDC
ncbi:hypothetical protein ACQJBY_037203 [Aegilops geniculata]